MAEHRRSFSRPSKLLSQFTGSASARSGSPGSDDHSSSSECDEPAVPRIREREKLRADKCLMGGPKPSSYSYQNGTAHDASERASSSRPMSWLKSRKKPEENGHAEKANGERANGMHVREVLSRLAERSQSARDLHANGSDGLIEQVAERLRERPVMARSGPMEETTSHKLEHDDIQLKIRAVDEKIERLMAKRDKYVSRLERLEAHKEKIAGPIQWSAWHQLSRMQTDAAAEMHHGHGRTKSHSPPQAESADALVR